MTCKPKISVFSEICTKQSTQSEHHVEFLNVKPLGFKMFVSKGSGPWNLQGEATNSNVLWNMARINRRVTMDKYDEIILVVFYNMVTLRHS